jgi:hypothetical protein
MNAIIFGWTSPYNPIRVQYINHRVHSPCNSKPPSWQSWGDIHFLSANSSDIFISKFRVFASIPKKDACVIRKHPKQTKRWNEHQTHTKISNTDITSTGTFPDVKCTNRAWADVKHIDQTSLLFGPILDSAHSKLFISSREDANP